VNGRRDVDGVSGTSFLWEFLMDVLVVSRLSEDKKELELLLRQQLRIVERKQGRGPQIPRWQKVPLAMLVVRLKERARNGRATLEASVRLFCQPLLSVGIGRLCDGNGPISREENRDDHRLMRNWSAGFFWWRETIQA
jgi:hypothetical protein